MQYSRFLPLDNQSAGEQRDHLAVLVDILGKELQGGLRNLVGIKRFQDGDIHLPVLHVGPGGNIYFIAVLGGIGTSEKKCPFAECSPVMPDFILFVDLTTPSTMLRT